MAKKTKSNKKEKTFKLRRCPECESDDVGVVISGEESKGKSKGQWECHKCNWKGADINEIELSEEEFMKYLDDKGEDIS